MLLSLVDTHFECGFPRISIQPYRSQIMSARICSNSLLINWWNLGRKFLIWRWTSSLVIIHFVLFGQVSNLTSRRFDQVKFTISTEIRFLRGLEKRVSKRLTLFRHHAFPLLLGSVRISNSLFRPILLLRALILLSNLSPSWDRKKLHLLLGWTYKSACTEKFSESSRRPYIRTTSTHQKHVPRMFILP